MVNKELELKGCKHFVCPNLSLINELVPKIYANSESENKLDIVIDKSKEVATKFFKKTYHYPPYSNSKNVLLASIYIGSILAGRPCTYFMIRNAGTTTDTTVRKHVKMIVNTLPEFEHLR